MTHLDNAISQQIDSILTEALPVDEDKGIRQIDATTIQIKEQVYQLVVDYREAFELVPFEQRYQDYFEKFDFIVGDWGFEQLRLRGFYQINQQKVARDQIIDSLEDYINEYCNFGCRYFVLAKSEEVARYLHLHERTKNKQAGQEAVTDTAKYATVHVKADGNYFGAKKKDRVAKNNAKKPFKQRNRQREKDAFEATAHVSNQTKNRKSNFVIKQKNKTN